MLWGENVKSSEKCRFRVKIPGFRVKKVVYMVFGRNWKRAFVHNNERRVCKIFVNKGRKSSEKWPFCAFFSTFSGVKVACQAPSIKGEL